MVRALILAVAATLALLLTLVLANLAYALDLGSYGKTYAISEPDFLQEIQAIAQHKVDSGEWKRLEQETRERGRQYFERPPAVPGLGTVSQARVRTFDPSITLTQDIVGSDGRMLFPAGTRVNPADIRPFPGALLYMSGDDTRQVALAEGLYRKRGDSLKVVLVGGSPAELMRKWGRPVYFDQHGVGVRRWGLKVVPALVHQARPEDRHLTIEELLP